MAKLRNDLTGKVFGYLSVLEFVGREKNRSRWLCLCKCGRQAVKSGTDLVTGNTMSCGCRLKESKNVVHGLSGTRVHRIWRGMINRCTNKNEPRYEDYGGRGITVCERWMDFMNFFEDMGHPPDGFTIDRVDNNRGYEPGNCSWVTPLEQNSNRRNTRVLTVRGVTKTVTQWAVETGLKAETIAARVRFGWPPEKCLEPTHSSRFIAARDTSGRITVVAAAQRSD